MCPARLPHLLGHAGILLACVGAAACDDPVAVAPDGIEISFEGRAERGLALVLRAVTAAGDTLPPGEVAWRITPEDAGTMSADTLRLARTGPLEVDAEYEGLRGARTFDVEAPPEILFDMTVAGNRDIYRAALDGRGLERLTTHPAADYDPTIVGALVVFVSERDGNKELYSLTLGGGPEERLTRTAVPSVHPALSPDGKRLAFVRGSGLTRLYIAAPDATGATRPDPAHGHDGTLETAPAWGPDGATLVFSSTAAGNPDIYIWSGKRATLLEASAGGDFEPAISPDGRYVAFASSRTGDVELYLLDLRDRLLRRLTEREGSDGHPAWLPDGRLVYVAYSGTTRELRWLDPADPARTYPIPLPGEPGNPVGRFQVKGGQS